MRDFTVADFVVPLSVWRRGRVVEGTSLLRKHMGLNLYRGFDSHRLRHDFPLKPIS